MKLKKNNKKGFTIVELVIVIAVIAILAAVLIPTFTGLIDKANKSADQQAVVTMNKYLAIEDVTDGIETVSDAIVALDKQNLDIDNYKPLTKDTYFYWVKSANRIVQADSQNNIIYPEDYVGNTSTDDWFTLSGDIPTDDSWKISSNAVSIDNAGQFVSLMKAIDSGKTNPDNITITLTGDINLMGATQNFGKISQKTITLQGSNDGVTVSNLRSDSNSTTGISKTTGQKTDYGYGLFGTVENSTITVKNITFSNAVVNDTTGNETSAVGIIAGNVWGKNTNLTVENVTIENCYVRGTKKVGAAIGYFQAGTSLSLNDLTIKNTAVVGGREVAKVIGRVDRSLAEAVSGSVVLENVTVAADASYGMTYSTTAPTGSTLQNGNLAIDTNTYKAGITEYAYWLVTTESGVEIEWVGKNINAD